MVYYYSLNALLLDQKIMKLLNKTTEISIKGLLVKEAASRKNIARQKYFST